MSAYHAVCGRLRPCVEWHHRFPSLHLCSLPFLSISAIGPFRAPLSFLPSFYCKFSPGILSTRNVTLPSWVIFHTSSPSLPGRRFHFYSTLPRASPICCQVNEQVTYPSPVMWMISRGCWPGLRRLVCSNCCFLRQALTLHCNYVHTLVACATGVISKMFRKKY